MSRVQQVKSRLQQVARAHKRFLRSVRRKSKLYGKRPLWTGSNTQGTVARPGPAYDGTLTHLAKHYRRLSDQDPGPRRMGAASKPGGPALYLMVPQIFSLAHYPAEGFRFLRDLFEQLYLAKVDELVLDYHHCVRVDADASACMDVLLLRFLEHYRRVRKCGQGRRIRTMRVVRMTNQEVLKLWHSTGTGQVIKGANARFPDMVSCPLSFCFKSPHRKGQKELTTTKLVKYLVACLERFDRRLNAQDRARFSNIIGEIVTNAEDHSSLPYNYSMGHFIETKQPDGKSGGRFQCVIFNFGKTIYERLKDPHDCKNKAIIPDMERLSRRYTEKRYFGVVDAPFEEETLWTLYALQDGVSSIEPGRGNGTMQFIQDFLNLRSREPNKRSVLTLLSGNTRIELDGTHPPKQKITSEGDAHTVITFNASGELEDKPDAKYVTFAPPYFPGTLLYADVYLTAEPLH